jgi:hypothetical protein
LTAERDLAGKALRSYILTYSDAEVKHSSSVPDDTAVYLDGWILGGGDRAPARGPRFGLIVLPGRKIGKGEVEMK